MTDRPTDDLRVIYEPVLLNEECMDVEYQGGAFETWDEAQAVLDIWRAEGCTQEMAVNAVPLFRSVEEWRFHR
jgi:hypothetical protein